MAYARESWNVSPVTPAEALADAILRAAGSGLRFYTMPATRAAIIAAAEDGLRLKTP